LYTYNYFNKKDDNKAHCKDALLKRQ